MALRSTVFRLSGGLLGIAMIAVGMFQSVAGEHLLGAISIAGTGAIFLRYAMTGRPRLFVRRD
jgi:hypothetical protein